MVMTYPENYSGYRYGVDAPKIPFSEGINYIPLYLETAFDFFVPAGDGSSMFFAFVTQLGKWGFEMMKIEESVEVSPVFQQYYQLTIAQKQQMEGQIKQQLASIATAMSDLDLVKHDWRRYKEFMDYYAMLEEGKKMIKSGRREEGLKLRLQGEQSLKAVFIDQVDVHTGETIALKLIAPRWPTIIADFMKLEDEDMEQKGIREKYSISEAEAVVLATKNRLYVEWRDTLFRRAVEDRFRTLVEMIEARKKSVIEYKNMARPLIARYKLITQALEKSGAAGMLQRNVYNKPDAQATSTDFTRVWAWKPFAPSEKYRHTREIASLTMAWRAGFRREETAELKRIFRERKRRGEALAHDEDIFLDDGAVEALPLEPSIDNIVRRHIKVLEAEYGVKIGVLDLFNARKRLMERFKKGMRGVGGEAWVFSPYYMMVDVPILRIMLKMPNGSEAEDIWIDTMTGSLQSQNMIIIRLLETMCREKALDNYIRQTLGEMGVSGESIEELERFEVYKSEEEKRKEADIGKERAGIRDVMLSERWWPHQAFQKALFDILKYFGIELDYLTTYGKYEWNKERIEKQYVRTDVREVYNAVVGWMKKRFLVPG